MIFLKNLSVLKQQHFFEMFSISSNPVKVLLLLAFLLYLINIKKKVFDRRNNINRIHENDFSHYPR